MRSEAPGIALRGESGDGEAQYMQGVGYRTRWKGWTFEPYISGGLTLSVRQWFHANAAHRWPRIEEFNGRRANRGSNLSKAWMFDVKYHRVGRGKGLV